MSDTVKLKHNGHARAYFNGSRFIEFGPDGTYEATEEEAVVLLGCFGVERIELLLEVTEQKSKGKK